VAPLFFAPRKMGTFLVFQQKGTRLDRRDRNRPPFVRRPDHFAAGAAFFAAAAKSPAFTIANFAGTT
jgi:hypothetical protein